MPFRRRGLPYRAGGTAALGGFVAAAMFVWPGLPDGGSVAAPEPVAAVEHPALGLLDVAARATLPPVPSEPVVGSLGDQLRAAAKAAAKASPSPTPSVAQPSAAGPSLARPPASAPSIARAPASAATTPAVTPSASTVTTLELQPADLLGGGIPAVALAAYVRAAQRADAATPGCHLSWAVLAGIGRVESNHGRYGGGTLGADGRATPPIIGPRLDGTTFPAVPDTDSGALDGDPRYDHAVGPLQFLPSTWARWGRDGDGDGKADPQDINDAAAAAGAYLCSGGGDLRDGAALGRALWSYNHDAAYVLLVAGVAADYAQGGR